MASSSENSQIEVPNTSSSQSKKIEVQHIINDPIHGVIKLHPLLLKIINTPQFGRLKDIKQLGVAYWIFPGASHNRFEHSIGTSYLCGKLIDHLRELHSHEKNGKIEITEVESLCVKVAGLCHDLGHGPFSHFFDSCYIPMMKPDSDWTHEQASCDLFDFMLKENKELRDKFEEYGLKKEEQTLIKDLILGKKSNEEAEEKKSSIIYEGSGDGEEYKKSFLYEIVNNKRNSIDCDKFDYFARDCHNVGVQSNFDCQRYFLTTRIMLIGDELQICVRDKEVFNLYELFHTRSSLHQRVYQHKTEAPIHDILAEALSKVDEKFEISSSIDNMSRYTKLTDSIIHEISRGNDGQNDQSDQEAKNLKEAQRLLLKIENRQLYKFCGESYLRPPTPIDSEERKKFEKEIKTYLELKKPATLRDQIFVSIAVIDSSKKGKDPIKLVNFFNKSGKRVKFPDEQHTQMGPAVWVKKIVRVYAKSPDREDEVKKCFKEMCKERTYPVVTEPNQYPTVTPENNKSPKNHLKQKPKTCREIQFPTSSNDEEKQ